MDPISTTPEEVEAVAWHLQEFLTVANWQWIAILGVIFVGLVIDRVVVAIMNRVLTKALERMAVKVPSSVSKTGLRPFGYLALALSWATGMQILHLPERATELVVGGAVFLGAAAGVWGAYRLVDVLASILASQAEQTDTKFDDLLVPLVRKTLKVFVSAFGVVFVASNLDINISSLLAGLGIGGLAFALAAQDTVKNLFGTLTIITDRPFDVGDWVVIGDVEGTVESVGFRSTRVRTFYDSLTTVPNGELLNANVDNYGARAFRRYRTTVGVTYDTPPDRIEAFVAGIRKIVDLHPYTRKDYYQLYVNSLSASSIDILVYIFFKVPDWSTELRERQRFILDVMRLADSLNVSFAFPTQTVHLFNEEGGSAVDAIAEGQSMTLGFQAAQDIVSRTLGPAGTVPPPVVSPLGESASRGDSGE